MNKVVLFCSLMLLILSGAVAQTDTSSASEAAKNMGQFAVIKAKVVTVFDGKNLRGHPHYLNLEKPFPDNPVVIIIYHADAEKLHINPEEYKGKTVIVKGKMEEIEYEYGFKPCIRIKNESQIVVAGE